MTTNCVHCGKERPYTWVGGQHCHAPNKRAGKPPIYWPFPPEWNHIRDHVYREEDEEGEEEDDDDH